MPSFRSLSIAVALLTLGVVSVAINASALSSGGIGGRPANPDLNNPRTQSIFIFNANKGETKRDVILVANNSDKQQTIELYAVDGIVTNTGSFTCSQESEAKQNVGSWITVDKSVIELDAGKTEEVGFSLAMSVTADIGEHNGCIVFQAAEDEGKATGNVRIRTRQAIRVVATVPGDLQRSVEIKNFVTGLEDGKQTYTLNLKNTGNVSADVDAKVYLKSLFGGVAYENGGGYPVLANRQLDLTFVDESPSFFGGWYYASAELAYDKRSGTFGTSDSSQLVKKATDRELIFIAPTLAGVLVILLVLSVAGGTATWLLLKRYRKQDTLKTWQTHTISQGDSIQSVANQYSVSWRKLVSVNRIAAPYVLNEGDTIRVPQKRKIVAAKKKSSLKLK